MNEYILGILWALGRYTEGHYYLRHKDETILELVRDHYKTDAKVFKLKNKHCLKLAGKYFDMNTLIDYGWSGRNEHIRPYPQGIASDKEFIRGYFLVHGRSGQIKLTHKSGRVQNQKRIRIYGNETLIEKINNIISTELDIMPKKLERTSTINSVVLGYYGKDDVEKLAAWLMI